MADVQIVSAAPQVYVRNTLGLVTQSGNSSLIRTHCYALVRNGSRYGTWDYNHYVAGQGGGSSRTATFSGDYLMGYGDYWVGHDANGNLTVNGSAWLDAYYGSGTSTSSYTAPRIPLAPTIYAITIDSITSSSARIGMEFTSYGHGTSGNVTAYIRKYGVGAGWTTLSNQADVGGYNYWTVNDLEPGTKYEYTCNAWNNMGDVAYGTYYTFETLPAAMMSMIGDF